MVFASCRLCSFACDEYKLLYDANGGPSEVYETVIKYFHSTLLDYAETDSIIKVICLDCWQHISDFHNFQQWILNARNQEDVKFVIKQEDQSEQTTIKSKESVLTPSGCNDYISYTEEISMFECENCKELFQSFNELETHFKLCQNITGSPDVLKAKHNLYKSKIVKVINVRDKNTYKCETCEASFSQYGNLRRHVRKHHAVQPLLKWICKYCNKLFKKKTLLEIHKNKVHTHHCSDSTQNTAKQIVDNKENSLKSAETKKFKISQEISNATEATCSSKLLLNIKSEDELVDDGKSNEIEPKTQIHIPALEIMDVKNEVPTDEEWDDDDDDDINKMNSNEKLCSESEEKFNDLQVQNVYLECPRCSQFVGNYVQLKEHFEIKHPDERCYINCCHLTLHEHQSIMEHLRFHKNPNAFKCPECGKCFKGKKGLSSHQLQVHSDNRSTYHLHLCSCKSSDEQLKKTLAKGGQQMEYDTRICCQRKKKILDDDELIAKWRKELTCEICNANFRYYSLLRSHFYYEHPAEKCYISCCQRKMSRISDTIEHIRFHLNPHLYRCQKCNVDFSSKGTLAKHMRNAHRDALPKHRWACDECDRTFEIRQILTRHKNVCHSKKRSQLIDD